MKHEPFQQLQIDEALRLFESYLVASHVGNKAVLDEIKTDYPDLFEPEVMALARKTFIRVAKQTQNRRWLNLAEGI